MKETKRDTNMRRIEESILMIADFMERIGIKEINSSLVRHDSVIEMKMTVTPTEADLRGVYRNVSMGKLK